MNLLPIAALLGLAALATWPARAATALADQPLFATPIVPGNLALLLSVEFPTAVSVAHTNRTYAPSNEYLGYFDPNKCYVYNYTDGTGVDNYFEPSGAASSHACSTTSAAKRWSGNFLNWATMQTIDPFRWALTGGYRVKDTTTESVIEKAWATGQGGTDNFPDSNLASAVIAGATPFPATTTTMGMRIQGLGNKMRFTVPDMAGGLSSLYSAATHFNPGTALAGGTVYEVFVRAKVCDASARETNCTAYGSNYKPEGLLQKYANKIRYSAFGYLNDSNILRDGGVLRAQQKYVGPTKPVPGSAAVDNIGKEWSAETGMFVQNPDATDATNTSAIFGTINNSGVINYLNKFGEITPGSYKTYDSVSELYYAAIRYFKALPDVPEWTSVTGSTAADRATWADGFPVITSPVDPILYSCQRNFVLGIGDTNTHADKNLPGRLATQTGSEPALPAAVSADTSVDAVATTDKVGVMEGLGAIGSLAAYKTPAMAGLAFDSHIKDIRPDSTAAGKENTLGKQTIDTYWVDVQEFQTYADNNPFYLAAKYGGFTVPPDYEKSPVALAESWWHTNADTFGSNKRPDNYFSGGRPDLMKAGLDAAFSKIAGAISAYTTSFSTALPQVATSGNSSFSSQYDAQRWTGELTASSLAFDPITSATTLVEKWKFTEKLAAQLAGTGWSSNRRVLSWDASAGAGVAFRAAGTTKLAAADLAKLDTSYVSGDDSSNYLNYLRGDRTNEVDSKTIGSTMAYRTRTKLLGDVVGSRARPVGVPSLPFSDATNPGYGAFKTKWATRRTVAYVGANDGMMHAINGALDATPSTATPLETDVNAGQEMFAYVPRALFQGPTNPNTDGLASLGKAGFTHHYLVNATPNVKDIDFARVPDPTGARVVPASTTSDWRSVLVGGLGKGGKAYYAIDVTDPVSMAISDESAAAAKVLWEFGNSSAGMSGELGFSYGDPLLIKTAKYGWVTVLPSGYNNADGVGYFLFVNPKSGALLEKVSTGTGSTSADAGLAHVNAFIVDATDGTADALYAGDLLGNLWRLDVTGTGSYSATGKLKKLATLTDTTGAAQPVTSKPAIEIDPGTSKQRFVMVGTGRLLDAADIASTQQQSFYALADGTNAAFSGRPIPSITASAYPISRSILRQNADATTAASSLSGTSTFYDPASQAGWYEDLGVDATTTTPPRTGTGIGWRVTSDPTTLSGSVAFAATLPNGSVCSPSGDSRIYGRAYASGASTVKLRAATDAPTALYVSLAGNVTDLRYLSVAGKAVLLSGTDTGKLKPIDITPPGGLSLRRLNWRELQGVD